MSFVEVGGPRLHYQHWGAQDGVASAVLVHGLGSSSHIWDLVGPLIGGDGIRVVAVDQRGHGESEQPDNGYDFGSVVADLEEFVDAVGVSTPAMFAGHSWGASVVLHLAVAQPALCAGIALVDGGISSPGERWSWEETEKRLRPPDLDGMAWSDLHQRISRNNGTFADPRAEVVGRSLFHVDAQGRVTRRFRIPNHMQVVRALWEQRPAELLRQVRCPLLIMPTRQPSDSAEMQANKSAAVQRALELQPAARVRWFEDSVHDVPVQRPEEVAAELRAFARQVLHASAPP